MKLFKPLLLLTVLICMVGTKASAYDAKIDGIYYNFSGKNAIVTYYDYSSRNSTAYSGIVTIPESVIYKGITYSVTAIGELAFYRCSDLTDVVIPNSVISIDANLDNTAWYKNQPDGIVYAGKIAYRYKGTMPTNTSISLKEGTLGISPHAFSGCSGLTSVTIPNSVTSIGNNAFEDCSSLSSVIIPNSVTSIGSSAFRNCSRLTSVTIPNSVTIILSCAFQDCSSLSSIAIPESVTYIGTQAFRGTKWFNNQSDGLVYIGKFLYCYKGKMPASTSVSIKEGTLGIAESAFVSESNGRGHNLVSVTIPNSLKYINAGAFSGCSGLTRITIPNSVTDIGMMAFAYTDLSSISLPNSVTNISSRTFEETPWYNNQPNGLIYIGNIAYDYKGTMPANTSISIKEGTSVIADGAFSYCDELSSITIPNTVTTIGRYVFQNCSGLTSITIPNSVTSIGNDAFSGCSGLTSVNVPVNNYSTFCNNIVVGLIARTGKLVHLIDEEGNEIEEYVIPNDVMSIGDSAFEGCASLSSLTFPNSVTSIGNSAFEDCSNLVSVTIPNYTTSIGDYVFSGCINLKELSYGSNMRSIGRCAFRNCAKMELINSLSPQPPVCGSKALEDINKLNCVLRVPYGSKTAYQIANQWKEFTILEEIGGEIKKQAINTSATGYATFYSSASAYTLPKGLSAQVVTNVSNNKLTYKTIADGSVLGVVPKGVAVMLVSDEKQTGTFTLTSSDSAVTYNGNNFLYGSDESTTTTGNGLHYKLSYGPSSTQWSDVFGWFWGEQGGAPFQIEANKAWLVVPKTNNSRARGYKASGDALSIEDSNSELMNNEIYYDLQGRRMSHPIEKGIYIKKGKIVVNK